MNVLPPLNVIKAWRDEGLSPTEVYQKCEAYLKSAICKLCDRKHFSKGLCKKHYNQEWYRRKRESLKVKSVKSFT